MNRIVATVFLIAAAFGSNALAQSHGDAGPAWLIVDDSGNTWADIVGDHFGGGESHCDNTSSAGTGYPDVDCWEWGGGTPRSVSQDCGAGDCEVSAVVNCPYLIGGPAGSWLSFTCSGSTTDGVRAGLLSTNPTRRGVQCGDVSCGCQIVPCSETEEDLCPFAFFFGSPTMIGGNDHNYRCQ